MESIIDNALEQSSAHPTAGKQELLGRLLAKLAHEIRNPLSSLDIHVRLLEQDLCCLPVGNRQPLEPRFDIIYGELHRLKRVVDNFLRLASPAAVDLEVVDLGLMLRQICDLLGAEAALRKIAISCQVAEGLPPMVADRVRLTQVLINLVINGVQAVGSNGRVELYAESKGAAVCISVRDTGPGIPSESLPMVFDPYFTTRPEGTGLGLWIAQQIASAHGGSIHASNHPGGGAVLTITLPQRDTPNPAAALRRS